MGDFYLLTPTAFIRIVCNLINYGRFSFSTGTKTEHAVFIPHSFNRHFQA